MRFSAIVWLTLALGAFAQDSSPTPTPSPTPSRLPIWECDLPGGKYLVAVRSIVSVSKHEYLVDGVRIVEVNVDTDGNMAVRFYYIAPPVSNSSVVQDAMDAAKEAADTITGKATPERPWEKVVKTYPTTTHAHTIEYRLNHENDTDTILNSASQALREMKSYTVKVD